MGVALDLEPVSAALGAVVENLDVRDPSDDEVTALRQALVEHQVLFFRDTGLDDDQHLALAGRFGQPSVFPLMQVLGASEPTFQVIEDGPDSPPSADSWHTDVSWTAEPPNFAFLRATVVPERGGDTLWASMTAAYEALSEPLRSFLDGRSGRHDGEAFIEAVVRKLGEGPAAELGFADELRAAHPPVEHPLIRTHPESGKRAIYFGGYFLTEVVGLERHESDAILGFLTRHVAEPRFQCRWRWRPGDLAIWDERSTIHRALGDHFPQRREVRRCVVDGERPYFSA